MGPHRPQPKARARQLRKLSLHFRARKLASVSVPALTAAKVTQTHTESSADNISADYECFTFASLLPKRSYPRHWLQLLNLPFAGEECGEFWPGGVSHFSCSKPYQSNAQFRDAFSF
jgi:hypothetical protein